MNDATARGLKAMTDGMLNRLYRRICERVYRKHAKPGGGYDPLGWIDANTLMVIDPGLARAHNATIAEGVRRTTAVKVSARLARIKSSISTGAPIWLAEHE